MDVVSGGLFHFLPGRASFLSHRPLNSPASHFDLIGTNRSANPATNAQTHLRDINHFLGSIIYESPKVAVVSDRYLLELGKKLAT
jgi:hypothetical protein